VKEAFEVVKRDAHFVGGRRDEDGVVQGGTSDPHRALAEFPRPVLAPDVAEKPSVHLSEEADGHRKAVADPGEAVLHCGHVILDLVRVFDFVGPDLLPGFEQQQLADVGFRSFDAGTEGRFEAQMGTDQQVRVGQQATDSSEAVHRAGRLVEHDGQIGRHVEVARQGVRKERRPARGRARPGTTGRVGDGDPTDSG
jgi:hypothetical protein